VKQKISDQLKSTHGTEGLAILRSVMDNTINAGQHTLNDWILIAK